MLDRTTSIAEVTEVAEVPERSDRDTIEGAFAELDRQAREWSGVVAAATAALVDVLERVDAGGYCESFGFRSLEFWTSLRCGVSYGHAKRLMAIARSLRSLPHVREVFLAGAVSEDHLVEAAKAGVTPMHDRQAADFASVMSVSQLRTALSFLPDVGDTDGESIARPGTDDARCPDESFGPELTVPGGGPGAAAEPGDPCPVADADVDPVDLSAASEEAAAPHDNGPAPRSGAGAGGDAATIHEWLRHGVVGHGVWELTLRLTAEHGALVDEAIDAGRDREYRARFGAAADPNDPPTGVSDLDGFMRAIGDALDVADPATRRGKPPSERYLINVHLNADGSTNLHLGSRLTNAARDELCCDAEVRTWLHHPDGTIGLGRRARVVSPRLRAVVEHRDLGCVVPGCGRRGRLHVHHIVHWLHDGRTDPDNLVCLCPAHHASVHRGEFRIAGNPNRGDLVVADRSGHPYRVGLPDPPTADRLRAAGLRASASPWRAGERAQWKWVIWNDPHPRPAPPPPPLEIPVRDPDSIYEMYPGLRRLAAPLGGAGSSRGGRRSHRGGDDDDVIVLYDGTDEDEVVVFDD